MSAEEKDATDEYPSRIIDYEEVKFLGKGSYGHVLLCKILNGPHAGRKVAVKILDLDHYNTDNWANIEKELSMMKLINCPNLLSSLHTFVENSELYLVMPYLEGGSCSDIMRNQFADGFEDEVLLATILKKALQGLQYLHEDGRIHRDVKAGNILISANGEVKLSDYGVSSCLVESGQNKGAARTFTGTPCWMAPVFLFISSTISKINDKKEVIKQEEGYNYKADIWSFGITALELAFGKPPYFDFTAMKILMKTIQKKPPSVAFYGDRAKKYSRAFKNVVEVCLKEDAVRRPQAKEILKLKFFKKALDESYIKKSLDVKTEEKVVASPFVVADGSKANIKAVPVKNFRFEIEEVEVEGGRYDEQMGDEDEDEEEIDDEESVGDCRGDSEQNTGRFTFEED